MTRYALLSSYPPRRCGLATFAADLVEAVGPADVVAVEPAAETLPYGPEVVARIRRDVPSDYGWAADVLDARRIPATLLQHEYGIFGGLDGRLLTGFLDAIGAPVAVTCHTVLGQPSPSQATVLAEVIDRAARVVVMSATARAILESRYLVPPSIIQVIPHGVPDLPFVATDAAKGRLGFAGRQLILSFGLLGPGKGYESAIEAMTSVARHQPRAILVIVGATHPDLVRREGEAYREVLLERRRTLGLEERVLLIDRYIDRPELLEWLRAADVFVTPYPGLQQVSSGTLAYAVGAGKPVVSTPYPHARELLAGGRGLLVEPGSPAALADAFCWLLADDARRERLARLAYASGRSMIWPVVGRAYRALLEWLADQRANRPRALPVGSPIHA